MSSRLLFALLAVSSAAGAGEFYTGLDPVVAQFSRVGDSSGYVVRKLESEGIGTERSDQSIAIAATPVLGYRAATGLGLELGMRRLSWSSRVSGNSGPTDLMPSDGGPPLPVDDVRFSSQSATEFNATTLGLTYTPRLSPHGELYTKLGAAYGKICSRIFEESDARGRTPEHLESRAGYCHNLLTAQIALGYTYRTKSWALTGFGELLPNVGSNDVVFVDGGGVGNQVVPALGLRFTQRW